MSLVDWLKQVFAGLIDKSDTSKLSDEAKKELEEMNKTNEDADNKEKESEKNEESPEETKESEEPKDEEPKDSTDDADTDNKDEELKDEPKDETKETQKDSEEKKPEEDKTPGEDETEEKKTSEEDKNKTNEEEILNKFKNVLVKNALKTMVHNVDDVMKLINLGEIKMDPESFEIEGLDEFVSQLRKEKAYLFKKVESGTNPIDEGFNPDNTKKIEPQTVAEAFAIQRQMNDGK